MAFVKKTSHVPITWWASQWTLPWVPFFVLGWNKVLILSVIVLQCDDVMFCYILNPQLFLWSAHLLHTEHSTSYPTIFSLSINLTEKTQSSRNGCLGNEGIWACTSQKTHKLVAMVATVTFTHSLRDRILQKVDKTKC
jgi:hypothetical protein